MFINYLGKVNNIITHSALASTVILLRGTSIFDGDITWLKFDDGTNEYLVADRNLRHSITWDNLNSCGIANGKEITINGKRYTIRLMTFAEWDSMIVPFVPLNEDSNWSGIESWTSTSWASNQTFKHTRGNTSVDTSDYWASSRSSTTIGWRPILVRELYPPLYENASLSEVIDSIDMVGNKVDTLTNTLKTNLINKGVEVEESDKLTTLINKIPSIKGFPTGWDIEKRGEVFAENIIEGDAILYQKYGSWDTQIDLLAEQPEVKYSIGRDFSFSPDGKYLAVCANIGLTIYKINGDTFTIAFNTTISGTTFFECKFSPDSKYLAVCLNSTPYLRLYRVDEGDNFVRIPTPSNISYSMLSCDFSPDGKYLAIGDSNSYLKYYIRNGDDFTHIRSIHIGNRVEGVSFSADGKYLLCALYYGSSFLIYKRDGDNLTSVVNGSSSVVGNTFGCAFSPDNKYFAIVGGSTPYVAIFKNNGDDTFTKLPNPSTLPGGKAYKCAFSPDGKYLAIPHQTNNPRLTIYKIENETFTKIPNPSKIPVYDCWGVDFSPKGEFLAVGCGQPPYQYIYRTVTKDIVSPYNPSTLPLQKLSIKNVGVAMESKNIGEQVKVNLFPKLNIL